MNWNAKDTSEIAINRIFVEHVDKEKKNPNTKTIYTANPCSSIPMNNGLGSRSEDMTPLASRLHLYRSYPANHIYILVGAEPSAHLSLFGLRLPDSLNVMRCPKPWRMPGGTPGR